MDMASSVNFWDVHGIWFIIFMFFFPRLTLLFSSVPFGGFFWWLGWIFAPRLLVAILATTTYWQTNTILVVLTWFWALGGEAVEKKGVREVRVKLR
jgi:hypothetical protein